MEDGELNSLIEGLSQQGATSSGQLLLTQQNHYVVSNTFISTDTPFPTPSPSPSIILRSPAAVPPASPGQARSPARPNTPQPALTQYSSIAPNSNQLVQLFQNQSNSLVGRTQLIQASAVQTAALKGKQPQQILPKPLTVGATTTKQTVTRINQSISQQGTPLLINQPQQNPTLLLNQVLTSSGPMLVQPAGGGGTVHLMLRPPTPTLQSGPGPPQGKVVLGSPSPQQAPTVLIQQNRQQVMRIMTAQGPMQMQLQQIQTPSGPQILAIPANQALSFPPNSVLVQGAGGAIHLQQATQPSIQLQQLPQQQLQPVKPKKSPAGGGGKRPKPIKSRSDSSASPTSSREDLSPPHASPKLVARLDSMMASPMSSPPMVNLPSPMPKNVTSSLRQMRPTAFARKQSVDQPNVKGDESSKQGLIPPPPVIDNLTATINSVAANIKSPSPEGTSALPMNDVLSATQNLNLNKRPNLTIFQKNSSEEKVNNIMAAVQEIATEVVEDSSRTNTPPAAKKSPTKKKTKKDENKVDLWDLMKSAGIGVEEFEEANANDLGSDSLEVAADADLLAQLQASQALQIPGGLRLAVGEDGRPVFIDGNNVLIQDVPSSQHGTAAELLAGSDASPMLNLTPQALATAQNQLTQLLQDHGTVTPADQQLLTQIFAVNPGQGLGNLGNFGTTQITEDVIVSRRTSLTAETESIHIAELPPPQVKETVSEYVGGPPPGLPALGPDSLVITNNNGVPTLVASPALLQYLQTHQAIIQFQQDPVTKNIQPNLIIPHPQAQQHQTTVVERVESKSQRIAAPSHKATPVDADVQQTLSTAGRNSNVATGVKLSMARMIQENPSLLQVAKDTNSLITYKETCSSLTDAEIADIDRKIQNNKNLLDQCFLLEVNKDGGKENISLQQQQNLDSNLKVSQEPTSTNSASSDFQNKYLESIGMTSSNSTNVPTVVSTAVTASSPSVPTKVSPAAATSVKRVRKKKAVDGQPAKRGNGSQVGNLTFNIKQLTQEQNERLNIALASRGVTAIRAAMCEMTDLEKQIIEEEIRKVTGGTLGNTTVKFFPPPSLNDDTHKTQPQQQTNVRYIIEDEAETDLSCSSNLVMNNPNLNQLLDGPSVGSHLVSLGHPIHSSNQLVTLGSPPPGSVIVGSNGQVVAYVQQAPGRGVPTLQLTVQKQQLLKNIQMQLQAISSKPVKTTTDVANLERLINEQQKVLQSGKVINALPHPSQSIQIVSQGGMTQRVQQGIYVQSKTCTTSTQAVSCGTNTTDMPAISPGGNVGAAAAKTSKLAQLPIIEVEQHSAPSQYTPLYVSPNAAGKHVTKCEKGTSPIQIQMGTQTMQGVEFRGGKMSTGTMTSPNTGKPQAVVAPAVHMQQSEPQPNHTNNWSKQQRPSPSPVITVSRTALIEKQKWTDESGAARPDVQTPFLSTSDAVKRLVRYHVMDEKGLSGQDLQAADDMFETTGQHLLDKFHAMKNKYKYLLLMESMREVSTAERIMVDRNFIIEERIELEELREQEKRAQNAFENPPPQPPPPPPPPQPLPNPSTYVLQPSPKTDLTLSDAALMELDDSLDESDSLSPFKMDFDDAGLPRSQPDSADINAQVQSAIDSILNLRQSDDQDERRKRKRLKHGAGAGAGVSSKKRRPPDGGGGGGGDGDPVLDEAIRSILSS